jgi:CheY-like chemotaxis protein
LNDLKADSELADVPVVLVTMTEDQHTGFALGASDYLIKPIDWTRLIAVLHGLRKPSVPQSVLIVEDDPATRELLQRQLEKQDWHVAVAQNGKAALAQLAQIAPAAILLDLLMPEMDGFEFIDALRGHELGSRVPVIVITAKELTEQDRQRLNGSVIQILRKGKFRTEELLAEINRVLATRAARART